MDAQFPAAELLLGEPLEIAVRVVWEDPVEASVLVAKGLLAVEVESDEGPLPFFQGSNEYDSYDGMIGDRIWFSLTKEEPVYERNVAVTYLYQIAQPGTYRVTVHWLPTPLDAQTGERLQNAVEKDYHAKNVVLLRSFGGRVVKEVTFSCPEREEDRAAFEFLAGRQCPEAFLGFGWIIRSAPRFDELNERFPTSRYMGYALRHIHRSPYGPVENPTQQDAFILKLANGRFLKEHPTVRFPEKGAVDSRDAIRARVDAFATYLDVNPGFQHRDSLELSLGLDLLALNRTEEAAQHWRWIVNQGRPGTAIDKARDYLAGLKRQGLLEGPAKE